MVSDARLSREEMSFKDQNWMLYMLEDSSYIVVYQPNLSLQTSRTAMEADAHMK